MGSISIMLLKHWALHGCPKQLSLRTKHINGKHLQYLATISINVSYLINKIFRGTRCRWGLLPIWSIRIAVRIRRHDLIFTVKNTVHVYLDRMSVQVDILALSSVQVCIYNLTQPQVEKLQISNNISNPKTTAFSLNGGNHHITSSK